MGGVEEVVTVGAPAGKYSRAKKEVAASEEPAALGRATADWREASLVTAEARWVAKAGTPT